MTERDLRELVLCHLVKAFPAKESEKGVVDAIVVQSGKTKDEVLTILESLHADGLVEQLTVRSTEQSAPERQYSITDKGRELVQPKNDDPGQECISPREIESRLISTYDRMKGDMEVIRQNLEKEQKTLETEMSDIRRSMADHDQFVKTYMVRIVESISMFIGIFAIVVVMMVNVLKDLAGIPDKTMLLYFVISLPILLIVTIIPGLWLIRKLILEPRPAA